MSSRKRNSGISVHAISGRRDVLLELNATGESRKNQLGFLLKRFHHKSNKTTILANSQKHPVQKFLWGDYVVHPGQTYIYNIKPAYRKTAKMHFAEELSVTIKTEMPDNGKHGIYFKLGAAGCQAYSRKFSHYRKWYLTQHSTPAGEHSRTVKAKAIEFIKPGDIPADLGAYT